MPTNDQSATAVQTNPTIADLWRHLRDLTSQRNEIFAVVTRYDRMRQLAIEQYNDLKERPNTTKETTDMLLGMISWLSSKREPLWDMLEKLETAMHEETERVNSHVS